MDVAVDSNAIIQGQADVEREALEISIGIDVAFQTIAEELVDAGGRLQINDGQVALDCVSIESCSCCLPSTLDGVVPG